MKKLAVIALIAGGAVAGLSAPASAGCLAGAAVGGVAGHVAGHHGLLGAAAGCYVGRHEARVRRDREEQNRAASYRQGPDRQTYGRDAYRDDERR